MLGELRGGHKVLPATSIVSTLPSLSTSSTSPADMFNDDFDTLPPPLPQLSASHEFRSMSRCSFTDPSDNSDGAQSSSVVEILLGMNDIDSIADYVNSVSSMPLTTFALNGYVAQLMNFFLLLSVSTTP